MYSFHSCYYSASRKSVPNLVDTSLSRTYFYTKPPLTNSSYTRIVRKFNESKNVPHACLVKFNVHASFTSNDRKVDLKARSTYRNKRNMFNQDPIGVLNGISTQWPKLFALFPTADRQWQKISSLSSCILSLMISKGSYFL